MWRRRKDRRRKLPGTGEYSPEQLENFRAMTLNEVRARRFAYHEKIRTLDDLDSDEAKDYLGVAGIWRRVEVRMRRRDAWVVGELRDRTVRNFAFGVHLFDPEAMNGRTDKTDKEALDD